MAVINNQISGRPQLNWVGGRGRVLSFQIINESICFIRGISVGAIFLNFNFRRLLEHKENPGAELMELTKSGDILLVYLPNPSVGVSVAAPVASLSQLVNQAHADIINRTPPVARLRWRKKSYLYQRFSRSIALLQNSLFQHLKQVWIRQAFQDATIKSRQASSEVQAQPDSKNKQKMQLDLRKVLRLQFFIKTEASEASNQPITPAEVQKVWLTTPKIRRCPSYLPGQGQPSWSLHSWCQSSHSIQRIFAGDGMLTCSGLESIR